MQIKNIDVMTVPLNFLFVLYTLLHRRLYPFCREAIFLSFTNLPLVFGPVAAEQNQSRKKSRIPEEAAKAENLQAYSGRSEPFEFSCFEMGKQYRAEFIDWYKSELKYVLTRRLITKLNKYTHF
jgi:hypothetical protein